MTRQSIFLKVVSEAKIILKNYDLCDHCLGRMFSKRLGVSSNKILGHKIRKTLANKQISQCYICKNLLCNLDKHIAPLLEKSSNIQFSTFEIGGIIKPSIMDRDDLLRSKFKLRGIDSVKTDITKEISKKFARKTKSKIEHLRPDLTITINFKNSTIDLLSKPVFLSGRYIKKSRGLSQKQKSCSNCKGKGCSLCSQHGIVDFDSVEGLIAKFLYDKFKANQVKFSWIGGEDKSSLVLGKGRPFFAKVINPKIRKSRLAKKIDLDHIIIQNLSIIESIPKQPLTFKSSIQLEVETEDEITAKKIQEIKFVTKYPVVVYEKSVKSSEKNIYSLKYKNTSPHTFNLWIKADGGLPVKRFVEGPNVNPNLSDILETKCRCKVFDFIEIELQ